MLSSRALPLSSAHLRTGDAALTSRRQALRLGLHTLGLGALAGLGGCGIDLSAVRLDDEDPPRPPRIGPDDRARFTAIDLVTGLQLQAAALPSLPAATRISQAHTRHLAELGPLPGPVPSGSPSPSDWPTPAPSAPPVDPAGLAAAEVAAATALLDQVPTVSGPLARLLAAIAASCRAGARSLPGAPELPAPPQPPKTLTVPAAVELRPALEALVAAEDAAGFAYGPAAARLSGDDRARAVSVMQEHTARSMTLRSLAKAAKVDAPAAPAAYDVRPGTSPEQVRAFCASLEAACARAAAAVIGHGDAPARTLGAWALVTAADAQVAWGGFLDLPGYD